MFITEQPLPIEKESLYRICGAIDVRERAAVDKVLPEFFVRDDLGWHHVRVVEEIAKRSAYVNTQTELANRRWAKERGHQKPPRVNGADTLETWASYSAAYEKRYGQSPVRNARVNGQLSQFVKRLGREDSPQVAAFFLTHANAFYVTKGHAVGVMLADAEKLRTEWATGRRVTQTEARQRDKTQGLANAFAPLIEKAEQEENAKLPK